MKPEHIIFIAIALLILAACLVDVVIEQKRYIDQAEGYIHYWQQQTDSLQTANHQLQMQIFDLRDSLITIKYRK